MSICRLLLLPLFFRDHAGGKVYRPKSAEKPPRLWIRGDSARCNRCRTSYAVGPNLAEERQPQAGLRPIDQIINARIGTRSVNAEPVELNEVIRAQRTAVAADFNGRFTATDEQTQIS